MSAALLPHGTYTPLVAGAFAHGLQLLALCVSLKKPVLHFSQMSDVLPDGLSEPARQFRHWLGSVLRPSHCLSGSWPQAQAVLAVAPGQAWHALTAWAQLMNWFAPQGESVHLAHTNVMPLACEK